jgi:hypothetical protein
MSKIKCRGHNREGTRCSRPVVEGHDFCLFHLPDKQEDLVDEFSLAFDIEKASQLKNHPDILDFTGFHFPIPLLFMEDLDSIYFKDAVFYESVTFWNMNEQRGVLFKDTITFKDAIFMDMADFGCARFRKAIFSGAAFREFVDFSETIFCKVYFDYAVFESNARFVKTNFIEYADFREAKFLADGDFCEASSEGEVFFNHSRFQNAWFTRSKFKQVDFSDAVFLGDLDVYESNINNIKKAIG